MSNSTWVFSMLLVFDSFYICSFFFFLNIHMIKILWELRAKGDIYIHFRSELWGPKSIRTTETFLTQISQINFRISSSRWKTCQTNFIFKRFWKAWKRKRIQQGESNWRYVRRIYIYIYCVIQVLISVSFENKRIRLVPSLVTFVEVT